tara:strand:- start:1854 stop:2141 length:288 start_codon:yes stop_codon:yes gene_type:complete
MSTIDIIPITSRMGVEIAGVDLREELSETVIHEIRPVVQHLYRHIENLNFHARAHLSKNSIDIWGNRCFPHCATWDYFPATRRGCRVALSGTSPS